MMTPIIVNPEAGGIDADLLRRLAERDEVVVQESADAASTRDAVIAKANQGASRIVAAGGDGTVHVVANALIASGAAAEVELGILPCGTGNDLARTLGLPMAEDDVDAALDLALNGEAAAMDVLRLTSGEHTLYAVNAAAGGFAGEVNAVMSAEQKDRWGPLAFVLGAAEALPELEGHQTRLTIGDGPAEETDAVNVILANGRTIAGGKEVAPPADVRDGKLDLVVVHQAALPDLAAAGARLLAGDWLEHPLVTHHPATRVRVDSAPPMQFNADGELWAEGSVEAVVVPGALRVVGAGAGAP
jgi:diacylglycerol kinase (ATP)